MITRQSRETPSGSMSDTQIQNNVPLVSSHKFHSLATGFSVKFNVISAKFNSKT